MLGGTSRGSSPQSLCINHGSWHLACLQPSLAICMGLNICIAKQAKRKKKVFPCVVYTHWHTVAHVVLTCSTRSIITALHCTALVIFICCVAPCFKGKASVRWSLQSFFLIPKLNYLYLFPIDMSNGSRYTIKKDILIFQGNRVTNWFRSGIKENPCKALYDCLQSALKVPLRETKI